MSGSSGFISFSLVIRYQTMYSPIPTYVGVDMSPRLPVQLPVFYFEVRDRQYMVCTTLYNARLEPTDMQAGR